MAITTDFKNIYRIVKKVFDDSQDVKIKKEIAEKAIDILYKRVKSGKGVSSDSISTPSLVGLKPLTSDAYKARRKKYSSELGEYGKPNKSNLTLTGQMLDALTYKLDTTGFTVYIQNTGRTKSKLSSGDSTNAKVAEHVSDNGRPFMAFASEEQQILRRMFENALRKIIRSLGLTRRG